MKAKEVIPKKWLMDKGYKIQVLYDDGYYSIIWGKYKNKKFLGVRYNDDENGTGIGYPRLGNNPIWYIEPDFIAIAILQHLLTIDKEKEKILDLEKIKFAINELSDKIAIKKK